jgi:hypothetical protein
MNAFCLKFDFNFFRIHPQLWFDVQQDMEGSFNLHQRSAQQKSKTKKTFKISLIVTYTYALEVQIQLG